MWNRNSKNSARFVDAHSVAPLLFLSPEISALCLRIFDLAHCGHTKSTLAGKGSYISLYFGKSWENRDYIPFTFSVCKQCSLVAWYLPHRQSFMCGLCRRTAHFFTKCVVNWRGGAFNLHFADGRFDRIFLGDGLNLVSTLINAQIIFSRTNAPKGVLSV